MLTSEEVKIKIREKLEVLHKQEDKYNERITELHKKIMYLLERKRHLAKHVSKNVIHRNQLIKQLKSLT